MYTTMTSATMSTSWWEEQGSAIARLMAMVAIVVVGEVGLIVRVLAEGKWGVLIRRVILFATFDESFSALYPVEI
jgi:hypothetical protein